MSNTQYNWLPICLGSVPHRDSLSAWEAILSRIWQLPSWAATAAPQLA